METPASLRQIKVFLAALLLPLIALTPFIALCEQAALINSPTYEKWRESAQRLSHLRLTYDYKQTSAVRCVRESDGRYKTIPSDPLGKGWLTGEGTLRVSRSGQSMNRKDVLERFEKENRPMRITPEGISTEIDPRPEDAYVEIHGDGVFFHYYPRDKRGSIWMSWNDRTDYPIPWVVPPNPELAHLDKADEENHVIDFIANSTNLVRYTLDPKHGMMPVRIEYYQIVSTGPLFLYRYQTFGKYIRTKSGAYLPQETTTFETNNDKDGYSRKTVFEMTNFDDNASFSPAEFTYTFPQEAHVRDNRPNGQDDVTPPAK